MAKSTVGPFQRIIVFTHDLPKVAKFYEDVLQLRVLTDLRNDGWIAFDMGGIELALHGGAPAERQGWFPRLVFSTPDVAGMHAHLKSNQVLVGDIYSTDEGPAFDAPDPEGNDLRFIQTAGGA